MYGRVTWYTGSPDRAEAGIQGFKDALPSVQKLPGYLGAALLVDRDGGEAMTIAYYRDQQALADTRAMATQIREAQQEQGARVTRVEEYEITAMERSEPGTTGSWGRVITGTMEPSGLDEAIALVQKSISILKQQPGFRSFIGGVNRETGAAFTGTTFDTREQLEASNAAVADARQEIRERGQIGDVKAQVFEIAVADVGATSGARV